MLFISFEPTGLEGLYNNYFKTKLHFFVTVIISNPLKEKKYINIKVYKNHKLELDDKNFYNLSYFKFLLFIRKKIKKLVFNYSISKFFCIGYIINFLVLSINPFKKKYIIYRSTDFFPILVGKKILIKNFLSQCIDFFNFSFSNTLIFTTTRQIHARKYLKFIKKKKFIIPLSCYNLVNLNNLKKNSAKDFVYVGLVSKYHLLDHIVNVFKKIEFKDYNLHIIGDGPFLNELREKTFNQNNVIIHGSLSDEKVIDLSKKCKYGLALYDTNKDFMYYTEPAKVKYYLSLGLHVLTTNEAEISKDLLKLKFGSVLNPGENLTLFFLSLINNDIKLNLKSIKRYINDYNFEVLHKNFELNILKIINEK